jgi:hypothetical protein
VIDVIDVVGQGSPKEGKGCGRTMWVHVSAPERWKLIHRHVILVD